jgi:hypothetical protein
MASSNKLSAVILLCVGASVGAQTGTVTHEFTWFEVEAGTTTPVANPNGILEPGEGVLLRLTISFDPPVGSAYPVPWAPSATVAGLGSTIFRVEGRLPDSNLVLATGAFTHLSKSALWQGSVGFASPGIAEVIQAQITQFVPPGQLSNPANPIVDVWEGVFTPAAYTPETLRFWTARDTLQAASGLLLQIGTDPGTGHPVYGGASLGVQTNWAVLHIPMIPAPGACAPFALLSLALLRRRRITPGND